MDFDRLLPALRPLDISPFENDQGQRYFALQDMAQVSPQPIAVSLAGYFVVLHLDGRRTVQDIIAASKEQFGQPLQATQIEALVDALDQALLLDTERYRQAYIERREAYRSGPARDNRTRWPDAAALADEIRGMLAGAPDYSGPPVHGIVAPHLDYERGAPCYADAYTALLRQPAERYVILGTNHFGQSDALVATRKDFLTPLGLARTDRSLLARLERRCGMDLCEYEFDHEMEHSIELQVHILQAAAGGRPFEIVPVLCPDPSRPGESGESTTLQALDCFAEALAAELADDGRPTLLIAGADLSHIGQHFGDEEPTTPEYLRGVEEVDRMLLSFLEERREDAFVAAVAEANNETRICSVGCIYTMLRALRGRACRVLRYHQAINLAAETTVTCTAAVVV